MMKIRDRPDLFKRSYEKHLDSGRITNWDPAIIRGLPIAVFDFAFVLAVAAVWLLTM